MTLFIKELIIPFEKGLEKETVNHLCCYNETNDNKSQIIQISLLYFIADFFIGVMLILHLNIVTDVPREKAYHLKPRLLGKVSMRPAYHSSKKVKDYDKLEAEVKKNRRMISLKETML
ncbi:hypothetical protein YC2023_016341 [Brassica napus]